MIAGNSKSGGRSASVAGFLGSLELEEEASCGSNCVEVTEGAPVEKDAWVSSVTGVEEGEDMAVESTDEFEMVDESPAMAVGRNEGEHCVSSNNKNARQALPLMLLTSSTVIPLPTKSIP